jgi:hypothetical protein
MSYNEQTRVLTIVYRGNRGVSRYFDVPPEEYADFRSAPSKGVYLNEVFKPKEYRYIKVSPATRSSLLSDQKHSEPRLTR